MFRFMTMVAACVLAAVPVSAQERLDTVPAARPIGQTASAGSVNLRRIEKAPWGALNANEKALRMNRDYDYPGKPTSDRTVIVPPSEREIKQARKAAVKRHQAQKAAFRAMDADQRRAFIAAHRDAFNAGWYD